MGDTAAILLAGGRGSRMRGATDDKVLARLGNRTVFQHGLEAFIAAGFVTRFVVVYRDAGQRARLSRLVARGVAREWPFHWVRGGRERQDSVAHALRALERRPHVGFVFIHDCARPLVRPEQLRQLQEAVQRDGAACLAHRVTDTIKQLSPAADSTRRRRLRTVDRRRLWGMETPQAFRRDWITAAYAEVQRRRLTITDDAAALEAVTRHGVTLVENPHPNPKITVPGDLAQAEFLLAARRSGD